MATRRMTGMLAAAAGLAIGAGSAAGQTLSWNNVAGGSAATAGNWSPAQVPGAGNDLLWNLAATYGVTFGNTTTSSHTQIFRRGTVTLTESSPHTVSSGITIGDTSALTATVTLSSGTLNSTGAVNLGTVAGSVGVLSVTDDSANFMVNGAGADMTVGVNGDATLSITGGGLVQVADQFILGSNSTSSPTLTVSGAQAVSPFQRSTLSVLGASQSRLGQGGDATVNVSNGAIASFAGDLVVSNGAASISTVTIGGSGGPGGIDDATLSVAGNLLLGTNNSVGIAAGTATVTVNSNGLLIVSGLLDLGIDPDGGMATLTINSNAVVEAGSFVDGPAGTLDHVSGTLRINGGTYSGHADPLVVSGTGGPTLQLTGGLSKTLLPVGAVGLVVGNDAGAGTWTGTLLIDGGSDLILSGTNKDIQIGDDTGTTGTVTISGAGSRLVANQPGDDIRVGVNGAGNLFVDNGGQLLANNILVPATALGGFGNFRIGLTAAASVTTGNLTVGNNGGPLPLSQVHVLDGSLTATNPGIGVLVRESGLLVIGGASLIATGTILVDGGELQPHGPVSAGVLVDVGAGGELRAGGATGPTVVDAPTVIRSGGVLEAISNDLTIGKSTVTNGFEAQDGSLITVGARTLTLLDADRAITHVTTINGGEIVAPNGMQIVTAGVVGTLDGTGTITTSELFMDSGGSVITATGAAGITINGKFRNNSGMIDGTKYTFNNNPAITDSGWTGAGTINARVVFNSGTKVNALANMTMGLNVADGVTFNLGSELHADTRTVTLIDSNGIGLGSVTDFSGGHIVCSQPLTVNFGRRLSGRGGSVDSPLVTVNGRLSPGELVGVPVGETGEMTINGDLTLAVNANMDIELGGLLAPVEYDRVVVNGDMIVNGTLNVSQVNGFHLGSGQSLVIASANSISGSFSAINAPPGVQVFVTPNIIVVGNCPADFNQDGFVDFFDYDAWIECFETFNEGVCINGGNPDFNFDGFVDFFDVDAFTQAFENGC